ncbi:MAG TPA: SDR family oxidoreductase [Myxococcota bacterium]|nr:SDR family oxidoreductase [Myxococcota bacterium]
MLLENKVAIVSGVGPGMGRDIALAFAREGANLALGARSAEYVESVAKEVRALGRRALALPTDITSLADCARLAASADEELGGVDVLVNNAYHPGTYELFENAELERWRAPLEVNLLGSLRLTQEVVPRMKKRGGGSIVFVNSMIVREVLPTMASYAASKGALLAAAQGLARELGPHRIRVNSVLPGYIWGATLEGYFKMMATARGITPEAVYAEVASKIALGRIPTSEEIAGSVLFFASGLSGVVTGQTLDVNGGQVMA